MSVRREHVRQERTCRSGENMSVRREHVDQERTNELLNTLLYSSPSHLPSPLTHHPLTYTQLYKHFALFLLSLPLLTSPLTPSHSFPHRLLLPSPPHIHYPPHSHPHQSTLYDCNQNKTSQVDHGERRGNTCYWRKNYQSHRPVRGIRGGTRGRRGGRREEINK